MKIDLFTNIFFSYANFDPYFKSYAKFNFINKTKCYSPRCTLFTHSYQREGLMLWKAFEPKWLVFFLYSWFFMIFWNVSFKSRHVKRGEEGSETSLNGLSMDIRRWMYVNLLNLRGFSSISYYVQCSQVGYM